MDEIEFRGKSVMTQEWIYGYYYCDGLSEYILPKAPIDDYSIYEIQRGTSGQLVGIADNGKGIYVGDILKNPYFKTPWKNARIILGMTYPKPKGEIIGNVFEDYQVLDKTQHFKNREVREWLYNRNIL